MLKINDLSYQYGDLAVLKNVSLQIPKGEIMTIVGPSGCGKSTLMKAVAGLLDGINEQVTYEEHRLSNKNHTIGYVPQTYGLLPWKTVAQNIELPLRIKNKPLTKNNVPVVDDVLIRIGLSKSKKKFPSQLSGGQRQRVALARAFVLEPDVLLLDEPFSALDAMTKEEMQRFFLDIWSDHKITAIFITHDIDEAVFLGNKVAVMMPNVPIKIYDSNINDRSSSDHFHLVTLIRHRLMGGGSNV